MEHYFINQQNSNNVIIGGVKQLTEFSTEQITVTVISATVTVTGSRMRIARFDENEISIVGKIINIETTPRGVRK